MPRISVWVVSIFSILISQIQTPESSVSHGAKDDDSVIDRLTRDLILTRVTYPKKKGFWNSMREFLDNAEKSSAAFATCKVAVVGNYLISVAANADPGVIESVSSVTGFFENVGHSLGRFFTRSRDPKGDLPINASLPVYVKDVINKYWTDTQTRMFNGSDPLGHMRSNISRTLRLMKEFVSKGSEKNPLKFFQFVSKMTHSLIFITKTNFKPIHFDPTTLKNIFII